ncbi:MAG: deoxynucleoside kinase [Lewinellaceae bacterium]|nr:deoxynucleoside kinase [Lewinella sp.]MCB9280067.1 deoxynucleoside kinase [Lewinellaceae bacterium]
MSEFPFPYRFIAIEGNIGAGKTTLSRKIAEDFDCKLILEQFTDNPFLPFFYENPERYAFPVELFFMTERHKQLQELAAQQELFQQTIVSDYFFWKTLLFARNNLNPEEFRLFQRLFQVLNSTFAKPDLLVYLYRSVDGLLNNIRNRNRSYEQEISPDYLANIQQSYLDFFHKTTPDFPILILDVEGADFLDFPEHYEAFLDLLKKEYAPGVHRLGVPT